MHAVYKKKHINESLKAEKKILISKTGKEWRDFNTFAHPIFYSKLYIMWTPCPVAFSSPLLVVQRALPTDRFKLHYPGEKAHSKDEQAH